MAHPTHSVPTRPANAEVEPIPTSALKYFKTMSKKKSTYVTNHFLRAGQTYKASKIPPYHPSIHHPP